MHTERPDSLYNLHYTHWGALNLRLKHALTPETPFGSEALDQEACRVFKMLLRSTSEDDVGAALAVEGLPKPQVDIEPWCIRATLDEVITNHLDYLHHEAFYVVDQTFEVTAYRTHWSGLQYDCRAVEDEPTIGNGALQTVRWYYGVPVGDGFIQGQFTALKAITGELIDPGVYSHEEGIEYLEEKLAAWVGTDQELLTRS